MPEKTRSTAAAAVKFKIFTHRYYRPSSRMDDDERGADAETNGI